MNIWQQRIEKLEGKGITKASIAKEANCSPAAITLISQGKRENPSYSIGNRIVELCKMVGIEDDK